LRLFSFGGYGLALAALALVVFGAYDSYPTENARNWVPKPFSWFAHVMRFPFSTYGAKTMVAMPLSIISDDSYFRTNLIALKGPIKIMQVLRCSMKV